MLLKNSLSGNCKTCLIVTIADEEDMVQESIASCRFGTECCKIKTTAIK